MDEPRGAPRDAVADPANVPAGKEGGVLRSMRGGDRSGQATVEFALASMFFLLIVFATVDFGRAVFVAADMGNAVREGARYAKLNPADTAGIKATVVGKVVGAGLTTAGVSSSCAGGCIVGGTVTVLATVRFSAVTQGFLGIPALTLRASEQVDIE